MTGELRQSLRDWLEPKYKRKLTDNEVVEIGENLAGFFELLIKVELRLEQEGRGVLKEPLFKKRQICAPKDKKTPCSSSRRLIRTIERE